MFAELGQRGYKLARRIAIAVIGGTVVLVGVVMLVTPGPGLVFIPAGLAILALEFAWARTWLKRIKATMTREQINGYLAQTRKLGVKAPPPPLD